jgi:hypothetical protein
MYKHWQIALRRIIAPNSQVLASLFMFSGEYRARWTATSQGVALNPSNPYYQLISAPNYRAPRN